VTGLDLLQILAMAAVWGGSFLFLRMAVPEFGPVPLIAIRVCLAALSLLPLLLLQPRLWAQFRENGGRLAILGLSNAAVPFPLFAYATLHVTAGFASVLNATAPLFAALVAGLWLRDRLTLFGILGLFVGFSGVVVLVGGLPTLSSETGLAMAAGLSGSLMYGISASFVKRHLAQVDSTVTTIGSFGFAALYLAPLAAWAWPVATPAPSAWLVVAVLAIACTSIPNIYYFRLLHRVGPAKAMSVAFLIPGFGMLWGALVLGEQVSPAMLAGCAVILLGTALVTGVIRRRQAVPVPGA
jgi:drug/metabolite transporter (DMT)-like permease